MTRTSILLALSVCAASSAAAEEIRISFWVPPGHAAVRAFDDWGASLSAATGGQLTIAKFPAQQLGAAADHYDMARDGIAEMTMVAPAYNANQFPIFLLNEVPFTFSDSVKGVGVMHEWYRQFADKEMPDVKLCVMTMHHTATFHMRDKRVTKPSDFNGLKIRTASRTTANYITQQGGATVQATLPEVRELLERGVVDGLGFPWDLGVVKSTDLLKFHVDLPIYVGTQAYVMNKDFYEGLAPDLKAAVDAHCTPEWSVKLSAVRAGEEAAARDKIVADPAHEVYKPNAEETAEWVAAAEAITAESLAATERFGVDGAAIFADLKARLQAAGAGF
ncbi:MAG: TRAP transporter substrate-binding protein [Pseudooceanicola sp.]|nr:TRAP transporter substrate-binding protein [Pseudooceanicola sp.]